MRLDLGLDLGAGAEEHVAGLMEQAALVQRLGQQHDQAAQQRPAEGERAGLLLAHDRKVLGGGQQPGKPAAQQRACGQGGDRVGLGRLAAGGQLGVPLAGLVGVLTGLAVGLTVGLAEGGPEPVQAVGGMLGMLGFGAAQPADQQLRTGLALLATGPLVATAWLTAITTSTPPPWPPASTGPWAALPLLGALVGIAVSAALLTVAAWRPPPRPPSPSPAPLPTSPA